MYKKLLTFFSLVCLANNGLAANNQSGFYLGGGPAVTNLMNKESHSVTPESHQLSSTGAIFDILFGYDFIFNCQYGLGLEGFTDITGSFDMGISRSGTSYTMQQNYDLGVRLLPEFFFTPYTNAHLILGYANGRFRIQDDGVYGFINETYSQSGYQVGVGLTTGFPNNFSWRLDTIYTGYGSSTFQGTGLTTPTQSYTNRFSQLSGMLTLIYKFF